MVPISIQTQSFFSQPNGFRLDYFLEDGLTFSTPAHQSAYAELLKIEQTDNARFQRICNHFMLNDISEFTKQYPSFKQAAEDRQFVFNEALFTFEDVQTEMACPEGLDSLSI